MQRQMMLLWGSHGVARRVLRAIKGNVLATGVHMMGLLILAFAQSDSLVIQNVLEKLLPFAGSVEIALISMFFLAVSLYLWARPIGIQEFFIKFFASVLTLVGLIFLSGILLATFFAMLPATVGFLVDAVIYALMAAYTTCLFARIAASESFNFRFSRRIFIAVVVMTMAQHVLGFALDFGLSSLSASFVVAFLQVLTTTAISTFIFVAAMVAFARHRLKSK